MRPLRWLLLGIVFSLAGACAGKSEEAGDGLGGSTQNGGGGSSGSSADAAASGSTSAGASSTPTDDDPSPVKHRATGEVCDNERLPGDSPPYFDQTSRTCTTDSDCEDPDLNCGPGCRMTCFEDEGVKHCAWSRGECVYDSDCTAGANGRCGNNRGYWTCSYDECFSDSECTNGGPCACGGRYGPTGPNTCMAGNCQKDADCGNGGYCSPTQGDCGSYSGIVGYYCHTPHDTCVNDSECNDSERGPGYCMYRPELGHWRCGYGQCVG